MKVTTITLKQDVAKRLREMFRKYGGRDRFGNLSNFIRVIMHIASFYPPDVLKMVRYAIDEFEGKNEMSKLYLSYMRKKLDEKGSLSVQDYVDFKLRYMDDDSYGDGIVHPREILDKISPSKENEESLSPVPPPLLDMPDVKVEEPEHDGARTEDTLVDEEYIEDDGEERDML